MPEWSITLITGLAGVLIGAFLRNVPHIIAAHGELKDSDRRTLEGERKQFLKDIRLEREETTRELAEVRRKEREEMQKELAEVQAEHKQCLEIKETQSQQIDELNSEVEKLKARIDELENKL